MKKAFLLIVLVGGSAAWCVDDMQLSVPRPPRAPLQAPKGGGPKSAVSSSEADEIRGEFGGILYMALKRYSYAAWPGKEMSDCNALGGGDACYHCEMITGHANAHYYFFREPGKRDCTLQEVDTHFEVSDPEILRPLKRTGQHLFGIPPVRDQKSPSNEIGWEGTGSGWKWQTDEDLAFLYMDSEQGSSNGEGVVRFQWRRAPLFTRSTPRGTTR